ncbi:MAG: hypothetical protein LW690_08820 [Opitutaceae bacterium]|nr:hypothetical protein [Opitutaceae bacterium]
MALIAADVPTVITAPGRGAVIEAVGPEFPTATEIAVDVAELPKESEATAVSVNEPAAEGVQATVNGGAATAGPICTGAPPVGVAKKVTAFIVAPAVAVAEAATAIADPTVADELLPGEEMATEVAVTAVTLTPVDVAVLPFVSVIRAVIV